MDRNFLELWGTLLLAASRNQKLFEELTSGLRGEKKGPWDLNEWLKAWGKGWDSLSSYVEMASPFDLKSEKEPKKDQSLKDLNEQFFWNWREWIELMNLVPREDYLQLEQENTELKEQLAQKNLRIEQLETLLTQKGIFELEQNTQEFQALIQKQGDQFQNFMESMAEFWKKKD